MNTPVPLGSVKELFLTALEHTTAERAEFLDHACAGDSALQREVESLVAAYKENGLALDTPCFELSAASVAAQALDADDERTGERIGPYHQRRAYRALTHCA